MADAGAGRHDAEIVERLLAPAQEGVALAVALELDIDVLLLAIRRAGEVHHHRVVDHQVDRDQRIDLLRVAAEPGDAVAHRRQIDHAGHAGEILHQDAGGLERHFLGGRRLLQPADDGFGVIDLVATAVLEPQHVLQQHLQADRQARDVAQRLGRLRQGEIGVFLPLDGQCLACLESVVPDRGHAVILAPCDGAPLLCGGGWRSRRG